MAVQFDLHRCRTQLVLCALLGPVPFLGVAMFGAPVLLLLAVRKGDRSLLLVLPMLASIIVGLLPLIVVLSILVG